MRKASLRRGALSHAHEALPAGAGRDPLRLTLDLGPWVDLGRSLAPRRTFERGPARSAPEACSGQAAGVGCWVGGRPRARGGDDQSGVARRALGRWASLRPSHDTAPTPFQGPPRVPYRRVRVRAQIFFVPVPFPFPLPPPPTGRLCRACGWAHRRPSGPVAAHRSPSACVARIDRTAWPGSLSASPWLRRWWYNAGAPAAGGGPARGRLSTSCPAPHRPCAPRLTIPLPPPSLSRPPAEHPLALWLARLGPFRPGCPRWPAPPLAPAAACTCRSSAATAAFPDGEDTLLCVGGDAGMRAAEVGP